MPILNSRSRPVCLTPPFKPSAGTSLFLSLSHITGHASQGLCTYVKYVDWPSTAARRHNSARRSLPFADDSMRRSCWCQDSHDIPFFSYAQTAQVRTSWILSHTACFHNGRGNSSCECTCVHDADPLTCRAACSGVFRAVPEGLVQRDLVAQDVRSLDFSTGTQVHSRSASRRSDRQSKFAGRKFAVYNSQVKA